MTNPLIGRWVSDEALTRNELIKKHKYRIEDIEKLFSIVKFGVHELIFTEFNLTTKFKGDGSTENYQLLSCQGDFVVINAELSGKLEYEIKGDLMFNRNGFDNYTEIYKKHSDSYNKSLNQDATP